MGGGSANLARTGHLSRGMRKVREWAMQLLGKTALYVQRPWGWRSWHTRGDGRPWSRKNSGRWSQSDPRDPAAPGKPLSGLWIFFGLRKEGTIRDAVYLKFFKMIILIATWRRQEGNQDGYGHHLTSHNIPTLQVGNEHPARRDEVRDHGRTCKSLGKATRLLTFVTLWCEIWLLQLFLKAGFHSWEGTGW